MNSRRRMRISEPKSEKYTNAELKARSMWTKLLLAILVCTCAGSFNAVASDRTWYCSVNFDPKPLAYKYVQTGSELFELRSWPNELRQERLQKGLPMEERIKYSIVEDTDIGLAATRAETFIWNDRMANEKKPAVYVEIIMIDKGSGDFRRKALTTSEDVYDSHGSCQAGK
jgi:hypothetical protein